MLTAIHPKLPMRNKAVTRDFYCKLLGFKEMGAPGFAAYLMVQKDDIELHFFLHENLQATENYGQVYIRCNAIQNWYKELLDHKVNIHPNGALQLKPWGQFEFSLLDPDNNLITFGQAMDQ